MAKKRLIIGLEDLAAFGNVVYTLLHAGIWFVSWILTYLPMKDAGNDAAVVSIIVLSLSMFKDFAPLYDKMREIWSRIYVFTILLILFSVFILSLIVIIFKNDVINWINILFIILFLSMLTILVLRVILKVDASSKHQTANDDNSIQQIRDSIIKAGKEKTYSEED